MIDLTPLDVRKKRGDFRQKLRGYDPEEVDTFLEVVEERLEVLVRENLALREKVGDLQSRLASLEGREQAVQDALVSAQALRKEVQTQTAREAEILKTQNLREMELQRREAEAALEARLLEAQDLMKERQRALEELERNRRKFLKAFRSLLERELDAVEVEEARRPLEDVPLDIQLRGWERKEAEGGGAKDSEESGEEAELALGGGELEEDGAGEGGELREETIPSPSMELPETAFPPESEGEKEEDVGSKDPLWISALLEREVSRTAESESSQVDEEYDPIPEAGSGGGEEGSADDEETGTGW